MTSGQPIPGRRDQGRRSLARHYDICVETLAPRHLAAVKFRGTSADLPLRLPAAFAAVHEHLSRAGVAPQGAAVCIYEQLSLSEFDVLAGFYVPEPLPGNGHVVPESTPGCQAAVCAHVGPYEELPQAYAAIQDWMRKEGWEPAGARMWEEYSTGPETAPEHARTEIYWPLRRKRS